MVTVLVRKLPWNTPVDFGLKRGRKPILGSHKTWRGLFFGVLAAVLVGCILNLLYWPFSFSFLSWSFLTGFGALFGDMVKSFFKRRVGVLPGKSWFPFDQIDFVLGALIFGAFVFFPGWLWSLFIILFSIAGHITINHLAFYLKIRKEKW